MPTYTCSTASTVTFTEPGADSAVYVCSAGTVVTIDPVTHPQSILDNNGLPLVDYFNDTILDEGT